MRLLVISSLAASSLIQVWGCSTAPQSKGSGNNANKSSKISTTPQDSSNASGAQASGPKNAAPGAAAPTGPVAQVDGPGADQLNAWCAAAAKASIVKQQAHGEQFNQLCTVSGTATQRFSDLLKQPYSGSGTPQVASITPIDSNPPTVSWFFGSAIKLPISSDKQFNVVGPKQGDPANERALMSASGVTPISVDTKPVASNGDQGWVRGWNVAIDSSQFVVIRTIQTTYSYRVDHYDFGNGLYMYVYTFLSGTNTIKDYRLLSAGFDLSGIGHLVTIGNVAIDDQGIPVLAQNGLIQTVQKSLQQIYQVAASVK